MNDSFIISETIFYESYCNKYKILCLYNLNDFRKVNRESTQKAQTQH